MEFALVVAGSGIVTLQCLMQEKKSWDFYWVWTLLTSCASWASLLVVAALDRAGVGGPEKVGTRKVPPLFLALLWIAGALVATLVKPFSVTGNGYFGVWAALAGSCALAVAEHGVLREPLERMSDVSGGNLLIVAVLVASSITAFLQTSVSCAVVEHWCSGNAAWVLVCSATSLALCLVLALPQVAEAVKPNSRFLSLFLLVWWSAGTVVTTFEKPYAYTFANGYFSCWAAVVASLFLTEVNFGLNVSREALNRASQVTGGTPPEVIGLLLASMVALVAASIECGDNYCGGLEVWAILCSSSSLAICFFVVIYTIRGGWVTQGGVLEKVSMFMIALWGLGAGCMTFKGPFHILGNGYLAAWAALICSSLLAMKYIDRVREQLNDLGLYGRELCFVCLGSTVLLVQALWDCASGQCSSGRAWGMACGLLSMAACFGIAFLHDRIAAHVKWVMISLFVWWSIALFSLTFCTTYVRTGNSYFACWGAWTACARALLQQFPELKGYADLEVGGTAPLTGGTPSETATVIGAKTGETDAPSGMPQIAGSGDFEINMGETPLSEGASAHDFYVGHDHAAEAPGFSGAAAGPPSFSGGEGDGNDDEALPRLPTVAGSADTSM